MEGRTEERVLALVLEERILHPEDGGTPVYSVMTKLMVNGKQVGMISELNVHASMDKTSPSMDIEFLKGLDPEVAAGLSDKTKESLRDSLALLRQFHFVNVKVPIEP